MRDYLKRYAFGNATWLDLIQILDARTPRARRGLEPRLGGGARAAGVRTGLRSIAGRLADMTLTQRDPLAAGTRLAAAARRSRWGTARVTTISPSTSRAGARVTKLPAPTPLYVLPNGAGLGYGLFVLDDDSRVYCSTTSKTSPIR